MKAQFYKYQALGNDMLVLDPATFEPTLTPSVIRLLCDRHFGLGADGICYGPLPGESGLPRMRFFNPDGSESGKSGNGLRIFARYVWEQGLVSPPNFEIGIGSETVPVVLKDESGRRMAIGMGRLSFHSSAIPVAGPPREVVNEMATMAGNPYNITAVTIGNPHCVIFVETLAAPVVCATGPVIETAPLFPQRTNVQFVQVLDQHTLQIEIWERGAGYTLASGTSSCAAAGAAVKTGRCLSPVEVRMVGGVALAEIDEQWRVRLTGEVEAVGSGTLAADLVERLTG